MNWKTLELAGQKKKKQHMYKLGWKKIIKCFYPRISSAAAELQHNQWIDIKCYNSCGPNK